MAPVSEVKDGGGAAGPEGLGVQPSSTAASIPGCSAGQAADILALGRAVFEAIERALSTAPEVRANRVTARWSKAPEELLSELERAQGDTPISVLAASLGVSTPMLRSGVLRLQRISLVKLSSGGVSITPQGRQRLARLELAKAAALRRIARGLTDLDGPRSQLLIEVLGTVLEEAENAILEHRLERPSAAPAGRA